MALSTRRTYVERLSESQGLEDPCKSTVTLASKPTKEQMEAESPLEAKLQMPYRADGARCNYIRPDRPDVQYAAKEICRASAMHPTIVLIPKKAGKTKQYLKLTIGCCHNNALPRAPFSGSSQWM